jgi:hypothetical protein
VTMETVNGTVPFSLTRKLGQSQKSAFRFLGLLLLLLLPGCGGCGNSNTATDLENASDIGADQRREEMLLPMIDNLSHLEDFTPPDIRERIFRQVTGQQAAKPTRADLLLGAWPETDMARHVVDGLNQWIRAQPPSPAWKPDPLTATLPPPLSDLPELKTLGQREFSRFDVCELQGAVWFRDVSVWARGEVVDDVARARSLFDWTVRNIQLDAELPDRPPQFPWETLLLGHGTAAERAEVFILLLRQLDIDAAVLAVEQGSGREAAGLAPREVAPAKSLRLWCVGVLVEGQVYLFDLLLGLPIPAPGGVTLDASGQLAIRPATLVQAAADDALLRRMDLAASQPYGVKASELGRVTVLLEAAPSSLSQRMQLLESRLVGPRKMALAASPTAHAKRWQAAAHVADVRLWPKPYTTLLQRSLAGQQTIRAQVPDLAPLYLVYREHVRVGAKKTRDPTPSHPEPQDAQAPQGSQTVYHVAPLYKGRVRYLKGKFQGDDAATRQYQIARPGKGAIRFSSMGEEEKLLKSWAKCTASYWSGLMAYQQGQEYYSTAVDWFWNQTLEAFPNSRWTNGARYNLARTYEITGETQRAVLLYGSNSESPGYYGDQLRARWLDEQWQKRKDAAKK